MSKENSEQDIEFFINEKKFNISVRPSTHLADAIRDKCSLTGTHLGCEHGVCGACTILVDNLPVRGCLYLAVQANGKKIETVEGLASNDKLNDIQNSFWENHGLQCGFCTPGFLILTKWMLENYNELSEVIVKDVLSSNICRCTGYQNIIKSVKQVAIEQNKWVE